MKVVGLTGGIGSGKSTVAKVFETFGVPVFRADDFGRAVLDHDTQVISQVKTLLGDDVYVDGYADRQRIAQKVFQDDHLLTALNRIVHPAVGREFEKWTSSLDAQVDYCIREAAILFESGSHKDCDQVVCVNAPEEVRIDRVMRRDQVTREQVLERMNKQMPESEKAELSDFLIQNDGINAVIPQVLSFHTQVMNE